MDRGIVEYPAVNDIIAGKPAPGMLDYLLHRRSVSIKNLTEPGPDAVQVEKILTVAMRVPDHGKLFPWYFIVFTGENRKAAGELLRKAWLAEEPGAAPAKLELEAERFLRAPVVIAIVSRIRNGKHPVWEQILSAGAACQNLCLAANALGFGTSWVTEWYSYSPTFRAALGLDQRDNIAGFIYIGTPAEQPTERDRPDPAQIVTRWFRGISLQKGALYGQPDMGFPRFGFEFKD